MRFRLRKRSNHHCKHSSLSLSCDGAQLEMEDRWCCYNHLATFRCCAQLWSDWPKGQYICFKCALSRWSTRTRQAHRLEPEHRGYLIGLKNQLQILLGDLAKCLQLMQRWNLRSLTSHALICIVLVKVLFSTFRGSSILALAVQGVPLDFEGEDEFCHKALHWVFNMLFQSWKQLICYLE